jgi:hypothetical protein
MTTACAAARTIRTLIDASATRPWNATQNP